ncbi:MAG: flagellar basal body P-ring protein FlgI [Planctomycetales bacterium]|nr:flagellar basal body P-ring protein FlgI [Planctomycetales bacterium]
MKVNSHNKFIFYCSLSVVLSMFVCECQPALGRTVLRNICRVKGQEENVLRGLGLVVGLNGTGEANDPATMRAIARSLEIMGSPVSQRGLPGAENFTELRKIKNAALVWVTARVPATGARRGDKLNCTVSAINGKSLEGGHLVFSALQGPNTQDSRVYALAEGRVELDSPEHPLVGRIHGGCQMEEDVITPFVDENGFITLVLEKNHADFQIASEIAAMIHQTHFTQDEEGERVQAINASNIVVQIPNEYRNEPVQFVSTLLELLIYQPEPEARVVINERTGSIVISGDVQIGDVVISHGNLVVEATEETSPFVDVSQEEDGESAKLKSLVDALNSLKVPNEDAIEIIKNIERNGKLHGRLIIE